MRIALGSTVTLHYSLAFKDGTVVASSAGDEPISIRVGEGTLDRTLELALLGLRAGQSQTLSLMPGQAFGQRDSEAQRWIERSLFPPDMALQPGLVVQFDGPAGEAVAGTLRALEPDRVLVDFNHPLAGHEVRFSVDILSVETPPEDLPDDET